MKPVVYELKKKYGAQVEFTYIKISDRDGRKQAVDRGFRIGSPTLMLHDGSGEVVERWFGEVALSEIEPSFVQLLD